MPCSEGRTPEAGGMEQKAQKSDSIAWEPIMVWGVAPPFPFPEKWRLKWGRTVTVVGLACEAG